jgi:ribonucleoside-diphosphate reductase beta chain
MQSLTDPVHKRHVLLPVLHSSLWDIFKEQQSVLWTTEEIDWSGDKDDWDTLDPPAQQFLLHIIAFFAASDMLIVDNLMEQFLSEVTIAEAKAFYAIQSYIETIHSETYATALEKFAPDLQREHLFNALHSIPTIKAKGEFAQKYMDISRPFEERLWAFCIFEGVLFASSFASLYWLRTKSLCKGLTFSNELIQRDESIHARFGVAMLNLLETRPCEKMIRSLLEEAVTIEENFIRDALPQNLVGLNAEHLCEYVRHCAERLMSLLEGTYAPIWNATQPLTFMEMVSIDSKTNFFEKRVGEYTMAAVNKTEQDMGFSLDTDF